MLLSFCTLGVLVGVQAQSIRINEIFADNKTNVFTDGSISDWVELVNSGAAAVNLSGYSLTDATATPRKWVFPEGVTLQPNEYLVVLLDSSRPASTTATPILNAGFGVRATGDQVELYAPGVTPVLEDSVRFGPQAANYTIGRIPSISGEFTLTAATAGAANVQQPLGSSATLRINEWMASPTSGSDWFELYNPDPLPVQLSGLHFRDSGNVPSPVAPLSYIGTGLDGFLEIVADNSTDDNEVDFGLSANGDTIGLFRSDNSQIDRVEFGPQQESVSQGRLPDGSGSILNLTIPTPGDSNLIRYEGLVVNELLSHTDPPFEDAVELYNTTSAAIEISGWYLSDSRNDLKKYRIPNGTSVPAQGFLVIYENQFNDPASPNPFTFSAAYEDEVILSQAINDNLTGSVVEESFEPSENAVSFGRVNTSVPGDYKFVAMIRPTFGVDNPSTVEQFRQGTGQTNSGPRVGPVVINEVMYNPLPPDGVTDNTVDEFVELLNIASTNVPLYDPAFPENLWRLQGGISFSFPANTTIPAGGEVIIVSFDPADATALAAFRTKFSVPASVPVFGPYVGRLRNSGDEVELYRPDTPQAPGRPDAGYVPFLRVDKVNYSDLAPWPAAADGTGNSLQRRTPEAFGNDPANWQAASPTPGHESDSSPGGEITVAIQFTDATSPIQLQLNSVAGRSYTVQYLDDLQQSPQWQTLTTEVASGSTITVQDQSPSGRSHRFYRISATAGN